MSGEGMSTDRAPFFDGTGFPRWKVLMQTHLQTRGLDVWRVTELGKKNETKAERQYDAIAKSILLSSLCDSVFNHVFANKMLISYGSKLSRIMRAQKMLPIKNIIFSARSLVALSNFPMKMLMTCIHD